MMTNCQFQLIAVASPTVFFHMYTLRVSGEIQKLKNSQNGLKQMEAGDGVSMNFTNLNKPCSYVRETQCYSKQDSINFNFVKISPHLSKDTNSLLIDFFIFILLSRGSDGGAVLRTNPDSLRSCLCFRVFRLNYASDFFILLLARFHQAEIIIVKHLIQGRNNNESRLGVEPLTFRSWSW